MLQTEGTACTKARELRKSGDLHKPWNIQEGEQLEMRVRSGWRPCHGGSELDRILARGIHQGLLSSGVAQLLICDVGNSPSLLSGA